MKPECLEWVRKACDSVPYGEVIVTIHNGQVTKVETREKKVIVK